MKHFNDFNLNQISSGTKGLNFHSTSESFHSWQALSVHLRRQTLDGADRNISRLNAAIENVKKTDTQRLQNEYQKLLSGLRDQGALPDQNEHEGGTSGLAPTNPISRLSEISGGLSSSLCSLWDLSLSLGFFTRHCKTLRVSIMSHIFWVIPRSATPKSCLYYCRERSIFCLVILSYGLCLFGRSKAKELVWPLSRAQNLPL